MKHGFVKVAAVTAPITVADCHKNAKGIIETANKLKEDNIELILFPELSLTSSSCGDLYTQPHLIQTCREAIEQIAEETSKSDAIIVVGAPVEHRNSLYNCAVVIHKGDVKGIVPKHHLDNHKGEGRWFTSGGELPLESHTTIGGKKVPFVKSGIFSTMTYSFGIEIGGEANTPAAPGAGLVAAGAQIILNPAAEHTFAGAQKQTQRRIAEQSARYRSGYLYCTNGWGESTSTAVHTGYCAIAECGEIIAESKGLTPATHCAVTEIDVEKVVKTRKEICGFTCRFAPAEINIPQSENNSSDLTRKFRALPFIPQNYTIEEYCEEAFDIQSIAVAKRIAHTGAKSCVIGISGGLDSTLALLVIAKACDLLDLPHSHITTVTMPGFGTSGRTYNNAMALMKALGTKIRDISIKEACIQHFKDIGHDIDNHDVTYENSQARERTQILMDIANQENGIVIGTGDLSELALGWATYNGDQMSMYGVNASVPKTMMQHMVRYIANSTSDDKVKSTLLDIVDTPISPELTPADEKGNIKQKTEDLVGPYELHDFFIYHFVHYGFAPEKIHMMAKATFEGAYDSDTIKKWLTTFMRRFFAQQFKRSAMPDGPQVTSCSLSPQGGWVMTADTCSNVWVTDCEKIQ